MVRLTDRLAVDLQKCRWMNGKIDDVRLPFSTVDPIMGDLFSIYWEPEMLQSMGQTISILATEVFFPPPHLAVTLVPGSN